MSRKTQPPPTAWRRLPERTTARTEAYAVRSRSCPDLEWVVLHHRGPRESWGCDCPATLECAHIAYVRDELAREPWRDHWRQAPDLSLVLVDRELASRAATLTADERLQWETCGDELARRALSLDAVSALLASPGPAAVRARGKAASAHLFGEG